MTDNRRLIAAFSEEQTVQLTGVTKHQLRYWDKTKFFQPSYAASNRRVAFSRVYSFADIVALRVLNVLVNHLGVSLQHLRSVSEKLKGGTAERWTGVRLYVLRKRVVWLDPNTELPQEILSGQYVSPAVVLDEVVSSARDAVAGLIRKRDESTIGRVERKRHINHNAAVVAGTRIPVAAIKRFAEAGYSVGQIMDEYPDLTVEDVQAALVYRKNDHAA